MVYSELTKKAMKIAFDAHKDQVDKSGMPYIYHPIHLAEQMDDECSTCVALLHDTVEDTDITFETLSELGFPKEIIDALKLLTHNKEVPYMEYIKEIKKNKLATKVKCADLAHNSTVSRLDVVDNKVLQRVKKYFKALVFLNEIDNEEDVNYYVVDNTRLVKRKGRMFFSISNSGNWKESTSHDIVAFYDVAKNFEELDI